MSRSWSFSRWLRSNSERYLLIAAQERVGRQHGARTPRLPHGLSALLWLRFFVPVYRALPWRLRHRIMLAMPGSHRRRWAAAPRRPAGPAAPAQFSSTPTQQKKESGHGTDRG